jgi:hypothetical protein
LFPVSTFHSLLALYTKLLAGKCLIHIGREGRIDAAAFFIAHLVSSVMYHADRDKGKCDLHGGGDR